VADCLLVVADWLLVVADWLLLPLRRRFLGTGRVARTRTRLALTAPPSPLVRSRGAISSRPHMVRTAPRGRSWLILAVINRVITIVPMKPQAVEKKPKDTPIDRSTVNATRKIGIPIAQAT
jgi:hypothetical protein